MKAWVIEDFGGPDQFRLKDLPEPALGPADLRIAVHATSVNPVDYKIRRGDVPMLAGPFPVVLHPDSAGVVTGCGADVTGFQPGDRVYAFAGGLAGQAGGLAETLVADARVAAKMPDRLGFAEAAALPLVSVTAWYGLVDQARVTPGDQVLIQGGTGGVGHIAVQLAKTLGATVSATCGSDEKCAVARSLGADFAFNYKRATPEAMVAEATGGRGFDVVFNTPGLPAIDASVVCARFGGTILDIERTPSL